MDEEKAREFLYAAIEDTQGTIRATDLKLNVLAVVLVVPLASLKDSLAIVSNAFQSSGHACIAHGVEIAFVVVWLLAMAILLTGLVGVISPTDVLSTAKANLPKGTGAFYLPSLFKIPRRCVLPGFVGKFADNNALIELPADVVSELRFEQLKLAYIREVKLLRAKWAFRISGLWLALWLLVAGINLLHPTT